jgi:ABC-type multidrug transport system permease subunit
MIVFSRQKWAGMSVLSYYTAKILVDLPRIAITSSIFFTGLVIFFPFNQDWRGMFAIIATLMFYGFGMGYLVSSIFSQKHVQSVNAMMMLLWPFLLSGVSPYLATVNNSYHPGIRWLWSVSVPRWMIECFVVREIKARPFDEKNRVMDPYNFLNNSEVWDDFLYSIYIILGMNAIALIALKLFR